MPRNRPFPTAPALGVVALSSLLVGLIAGPPASAVPQPDEVSPVSVVSEGEVRFADRLVDGRLELGLRDVSTDAPEWLDPSETVIHLPTQDADWLCRITGALSCRTANVPAWEAIAPSGSLFWTTKKNAVTGNALKVNFDAGLVPTSQVVAPPQFTFGGLETTGDGYFVMWPDQAKPARTWDSREGLKDPISAGTSETGAVLTPSKLTLMTFSAPGVYHLTIDTSAFAVADGAVLEDSAVFTIVVGPDIDPTTITPAPQPDDNGSGGGEEPVRDDGVAVLAAGDIRIAPVLDGDDYTLRVVDHRGATPEVLDARETIFSVPNQSTAWPGERMTTPAQQQAWEQIVPRGTVPWRTRGNVGQSSEFARNDLILSLDNARASLEGATNRVSLQSATGPGDFASYRVDRFDLASPATSLVWDSRSIATSQAAAVSGRTDSGWAFTAPGVYCVTLRSALGDNLAAATFTVVVGDTEDPFSVAVCAQEEAQIPGEGGGGDGGDGADLDPTVTYLDIGHTDLAVDLIDDELRFGADLHEFHDLDDTIWVGQRPANRFTVPTVAPGRDYTFIGQPGETYWGFTQLGNAAISLWPGLSTQAQGLREKIHPDSVLSFGLLGVSGPGDVVVFSNNVADGRTSDIYWSSTQGYPQSRSFERGNHSHMNWAFTEQGVYCLNWQATMRLADDTNRTTTDQLTVVVGDQVDLSEVQPCGRDTTTPAPVGTVATPNELAAEPVLLDAGQALIAPYLDGSDVQVFARVQDIPTSSMVARDVESLIFSTSRTMRYQPWGIDGWLAGHDGYGATDISWDTDWLDPARLSADPTLSIGEVEGPGTFSAIRSDWAQAASVSKERILALGTAADAPSTTTLRAGWRERHIMHTFSSPGVYCVPLTWTVDLVGGGTSSVSKTLTFVAGSTDPNAADYVDRTGLVPCAQGGEATDPGGEEPGGGGEDPDPIDELPDSDATVLDSGHVDIASLIDDGRLATRIKDDTTGSDEPVIRDLDDIVFHVTALAKGPVPAGDDYAFLGSPGSSTWLLPATQDSLLLWPGWSTELIPDGQLSSDVEWRLTDISGPGEFALFETGTFGDPIVRWNTRDGITAADSFPIAPATHAHGNWAFSAEGVYCLAFDRTATLATGGEQTVSSVLAVAVGDVDPQKVDPSKCFTEPEGRPDGDDTSPISLSDLDDHNVGGVQVLGGDNGFLAGELVTVQVGAPRAAQWVSVWFDDTSWLGWVQVGTSGAIQVRLPADAAARAHVLVVKDRDGGLIGWDSLSVVASTDPGDGGDPGGGGEEPAPDPDAVWDVANGTVNEAGATVLNNGHVDIASLIQGGALVTRVKDTTQTSDPIWREPTQTVLQLLPGAQTTVPSGDQWAFLGAAGSTFHQVSQTQQAGLLWPGWSTESIGLSVTQGGVDWALTDVSGPGEFALYETGSFGQPSVLFSTRDGITTADRITIPKATHAHGSWAFSAEGNYCLAFERSTVLAGGQGASDEFVVAVAVGRADVSRFDPSACFRAPAGEPTTADVEPIADDLLIDSARGDVEMMGDATSFTPGQLQTVAVGAVHAGAWVSVWLHSEPVWLGWTKVDADGNIQVRLPADAALGAHRLVVKSVTGELLGWDALTIVAAPTQPAPGGGGAAPGTDIPASIQVPTTQCVAGATILSAGHIDYATRIVGGKVESLIGDDTSGSKVYREPSGTILWLKPPGRVTLPAGYGAVGAPGSQVWQVPQTQNPNLIWLGWNTESLNAGNTRGPVAWTIDGISGPGSVKVYLTGSFGGVQSMVFNNGGSYSIPLGVHAHANWAFSAEGVYRITSTQTVTLANGQVSSDTETLTIVVGDVDPRTAAGTGSGCGTVSNALLLSDDTDAALVAADQAVAEAAEAARRVVPGQSVERENAVTDPFIALSEGNPVPLLLSILGLLLLAGAAGAGVLWWRRRATRAHGDAA